MEIAKCGKSSRASYVMVMRIQWAESWGGGGLLVLLRLGRLRLRLTLLRLCRLRLRSCCYSPARSLAVRGAGLLFSDLWRLLLLARFQLLLLFRWRLTNRLTRGRLLWLGRRPLLSLLLCSRLLRLRGGVCWGSGAVEPLCFEVGPSFSPHEATAIPIAKAAMLIDSLLLINCSSQRHYFHQAI